MVKKTKSSQQKPKHEVTHGSARKSSAASAEDDDATYDASKDRAALRTYVAAWGDPDAEDAAAFSALFTDTQRANIGRRTKAVNVFRGAVRCAGVIHRSLTTDADLVQEYYALPRYQYLLAQITALGVQIVKDEASRGATGGGQASLSTLQTALRGQRRKLVSKLRSVLGEGDALSVEFKDALKQGDVGDALATSTASLATIAKKAIASTDAKLARRCAAEGLIAAIVTRAAEAAAAVGEAGGAVAVAGGVVAIDSRKTNLAEGSVVHELREARRRFAEGNEDTQILPTIPVPKGLEHVMGSRAQQENEPAPDLPPDPPPPPVIDPVEPPDAPPVTDPTVTDATTARADASKTRR
jgi:hypothetical protein